MSELDLPYQTEGSAFLARKSRAGLYDEMGLGKSFQAIRAADKAGLKRGLVVAPAAARAVWDGEFRKFQRAHRRVLIMKTIQDLNVWLRGKCDVLILSYEQATKNKAHLEGDMFDFLIFDEAHYLKNKGSSRTIAMLGAECDGKHGLARWAVFVWFLTGTPNSNDAADVWSMMRFCNATRLDQRIFRDRYYTARTGTYSAAHDPRPDMVPELRQAISSFSITRTKQGVGMQLPPLWLTTVTVDGDTREIAALLRQYPDMERSVMQAVEKGGLSFLDAQHIATLRRLVGEAKAPAYGELISSEFDSGLDKLVVFGIHQKALLRIGEVLSKNGISWVGGPGAVDARDVRAFQEEPAKRAFLVNMKAGGTAITLTAAAAIDLFERSWSPADNAQALMRVHRIGQTRNVHGRDIVLAKSIDEKVGEVVTRKTQSIMQVGAGTLIQA